MGRGERLARVAIPLSYLLAVGALVAAVALTIEGQFLVGPLGYVSSISLGSVAAIYALGQYRFQDSGYPSAKSVVLALLFANAFLQSYELVYGLTFGLGYFMTGHIVVTGPELRSFLLWAVLISPVVLVRETLRPTSASWFLLLLAVSIWFVWILYGYPQYYLSSYAFARVLTTSDPYQTSLWLNFGSKVVIALFFISLLEPAKALRAALRR